MIQNITWSILFVLLAFISVFYNVIFNVVEINKNKSYDIAKFDKTLINMGAIIILGIWGIVSSSFIIDFIKYF